MYCLTCGTQLVRSANFCHHCGELGQDHSSHSNKSITEAAILISRAGGTGSQTSRDRSAWMSRAVILIDEAHKERTWADDYAPFKTHLGKRGTVVVNRDRPIAKRHLEGVNLLVIGGPENPWLVGRGTDRWRDEEIDAIQDFVESGGGLLVLGDSLASAKNMSALTRPFGVVLTRDLVRDVTVHKEDILPHEVVAGVREIRLGALRGGGGMCLEVAEPAITVVRHEDKPVLAVSRYGQGHVVVVSSLAAFSGSFLYEADNEALLDGMLEVALCKEPASISSDSPSVVHAKDEKTIDLEVEQNTLNSREIEAPWREALEALIEVWETWNRAFQTFVSECEAMKDATFPTDRDLLLEVWARNIHHWQPRFLNLMRDEVNLWSEIEASDGFNEAEHRLLHALQVNRSMAIWQRQQHLEILKHQLEAMKARDKFAVNELLTDALEIDKASSLLRNEYAQLLKTLRERGLPLPQQHIPELEHVGEDDRETGQFVIERLLPFSIFRSESEADRWMIVLEDWLEAKAEAEVAAEGNARA